MSYWEVFRMRLTEYLKSAVVKAALLKFLGKAIATGWQGWLITFVAENLFEEIAEPIIRESFRKAGWLYDRIEGEVTLKRIKDAKKENSKHKYIKSISGV